MINGIILVLVLAVLILAVKSTVKHFRGECSCCGGSKGLIKETEKKLSNPIVGKKTISIEGMTCDHCRQSVEKALNAMDGGSARVNLKKSKLLWLVTGQWQIQNCEERWKEPAFK